MVSWMLALWGIISAVFGMILDVAQFWKQVSWFHSKGQLAIQLCGEEEEDVCDCWGSPNNHDSVKPCGQPGIWLRYWSGKTDKYIEIVFMVEIKVPEETALPHPGHGAEL